MTRSPQVSSRSVGSLSPRTLFARPREKALDVGPQLGPLFSLVVGEYCQVHRVTHARQVRLLLPLPEGLLNCGTRLRGIAAQMFGPDGEFVAQPAEGLPAPASPNLVGDPRGVRSMAASGQRRHAGGCVPVPSPGSFCQFRIGC